MGNKESKPPSPAPTYTPYTLAPTPLFAQWADASVEPFDCANHSRPIQIIKPKDENGDFQDNYEIREIDLATGEYETLWEIDYLTDYGFSQSAGLNGAAMLDAGASGVYAFTAIECSLCRLDLLGNLVCFDEELSHGVNPNGGCTTAGAILGTTYYYAEKLGEGSSLYYVERIHTDVPVFHDQYTLVVDESLVSVIHDITPVAEADADDAILDGAVSGYILGLSYNGTHLIVVDVGADAGPPSRYAIIDVEINWNGQEESTRGSFGAAYTYYGVDVPRVFATGNSGGGLFELSLPLAVDDACWNYGTSTTDHAGCASSTATITYRAPSARTSRNDGMNCPNAVATIPKTLAPTPVPTPQPTPVPTPAPTSMPAMACSPTYTAVYSNIKSPSYAEETTATSIADCCDACDGSDYECLAIEYNPSTQVCWLLFANWGFYIRGEATEMQPAPWEACLKSDGEFVSKNIVSPRPAHEIVRCPAPRRPHFR